VQARLDGRTLRVKGKLGELSYSLPEGIGCEQDGGLLRLLRANDEPRTKALHGLARALINNMVVGVSEGFTRRLEVRGTGYRAAVSGQKLTLNVGYSHPVVVEFPRGIAVRIEGTTTREQLPTTVITVQGIDKGLVGHWADMVRRVRPPEPFKGKGIRYEDERVVRKAGKTG